MNTERMAGFPARAGMDPRTMRDWVSTRRIPRTRGDGPRAHPRADVGGSDSPHARGWTRRADRGAGGRAGFPARAGMDPASNWRSRTPTRIPRTRGDGPSFLLSPYAPIGDSPHARGWTRPSTAPAPASLGFPARAGMDPSRKVSTPASVGIPRTRGDGPGRESWPAPCFRDSPHARGWTRGDRERRAAGRGFPARAGMDPPPPCARGGGRWIPRTRGDGPAGTFEFSWGQMDSPHARGWTVMWPKMSPLGEGFPARAGMDPGRSARRRRGCRIPRTRGDGPADWDATAGDGLDSPHARGWTHPDDAVSADGLGFPARAGMDRRRRRATAPGRGIPRTRGDGPKAAGLDDRDDGDSPHARGWTRAPGGARTCGGGFPARAGMDPVRAASGPVDVRIPRTRGDGPEGGIRCSSGAPDSPHARGWTPARPRASGPGRGFPARAGMDPSLSVAAAP